MNRDLNYHSLATIAILATCCIVPAQAQPNLTHSVPGAILPTGATRVVLQGDKFSAPLRVWTNAPVTVSVVDVQPQKATIDVTPQEALSLGPFGIWVATNEGLSPSIALLVDELPSVAELPDNHSPVTAQTIGMSAAIDAGGDGKHFDYFRLHAESGQEVTFEVLSQHLGSSFDPVVRLLTEDLRPLLDVDDEAIGPDCRFRYRFEKSGNYLLELHDNRFAAGGRYRLRIGNFPLVNFAYPPVAQRGTCAQMSFGGVDGARVASLSTQVPDRPLLESMSIVANFKDGGSPTWASIRLASGVQMSEAEPNNSIAESNALESAVGINGLLQQPGDQDFFKLKGAKDKTLRFTASSQSFGSPTLLKMSLRKLDGTVIAKTTVGDSDEWQFDAKFPADGEFVLQVEDLLRRGGPEYGYHLAISELTPFRLALKPDAKTRERFAMEPIRGAAAMDLLVQRETYKGPIALKIEPPINGLKILNPLIAADAKEARIYLLTEAGWSADGMSSLRIVGSASDGAAFSHAVSTKALLVQRAPHVPYPQAWQDGLVPLAGIAEQPAFFELQPAAEPIALARSLADGKFTLPLKRVQAEFKEAVALIHSELPSGWTVATKLDKDVMEISLKRPAGLPEGQHKLRFLWYGDFKGRAQVFESNVAVRLIDPLQVTVSPATGIKPGEQTKMQVEIVRGAEPQAVTLKLLNLPVGVSGPESISIAAADSKTEIVLTAAADAQDGIFLNVFVSASTKFGDQEFTALSAGQELEVLPPLAASEPKNPN